MEWTIRLRARYFRYVIVNVSKKNKEIKPKISRKQVENASKK
jgi:hypothetical protein